MKLDGCRIVVLGAGASGRAAALLAAERGAKVTVADTARADRLSGPAVELLEQNVRLLTGQDAIHAEPGVDLVVLSPGIPPESPFVSAWTSGGAELIGEIEFAWRQWPGRVVAITGTNGKTTCTGLVAQILRGGGIVCEPAGNHGKPFSQIVREESSRGAAVLELSSFQLETISTFHPEVAVWLNFAPDHMDRYATVADYRAGKERIFLNQDENDHAVVNALEFPSCPLRARTVTFSGFGPGDFALAGDGDRILFQGEEAARLSETHLLGRHNAENLMAALATGWIYGLPFEGMRKSAGDFLPPPHRSEFVGRFDGVTYVNDSKSTNVHALQSGLRAQSGPVVLIAGGKNKGLDYGPLAGLLREKVRKLIAVGEIRRQWVDLCSDWLDCAEAGSLESAVRLAREAAKPGDVVLFSPGTSSFDMFRDFEQRGEAFRAAVQQCMRHDHVC